MVDTGTVNSGQWTQARWTQRMVDTGTANSGRSGQWTQWTQRTQWTVDTAHSELYFAVFNNRVSIAQTVLFDTTSVV